ncbi:hypothetical protein F5878DRAFT_700127 [Lentinula raphanica]|uniref:Uncharacterized protein n=1 Tax=Lentinula raphanica TaxID=153919 RepID=A0AA38NZ19_9AGAR|nr:hypothetical protein F5878DRAFT_700127 [Lentinula raphanica]
MSRLSDARVDTNDDNELDLPFHPEEWIGRGKRYDTAPLYVLVARGDEEKVPTRFQAFYPSSTLSIKQYLRFPLPKKSYALSMYSPKKWFSKEPPTPRSEGELWKLLYTRPLPTSSEIQTLYTTFGQEWLDGAQSLCDPRINSGKDRLPLWFLTVWHDVLGFVDTQSDLEKAWRAGQELVTLPDVMEEFPTVESIFRDVKWNEVFTHGGVKIKAYEFAPLLRKVMLSSLVTQGMISYLQDRLHRDTVNSKKHYICGSGFAGFIAVAETRNKLHGRCLQDIENAVRRHQDLQIWVPVLREQHEVVIKIDFGAKTIGYGDTLPKFSPPKVIGDHLQRWIKLTFGENFEWVGKATVVHGTQEDAISCIPGTANMIAHGIWGDELWSDGKKMVDRTRWFVRLTESPSSSSNIVQAEHSDPTAASTIAPRTRPDLDNLLHPCSFVESLTRSDLIDAMSIIPSSQRECEILAELGAESTAVQQTDNQSCGSSSETEVPVAAAGSSLQMEEGPPKKGLNAAWGMFMKKVSETAKRNRSPSPSNPRKKVKDFSAESNESISGPTGLSKAAIAEKRYAKELDEGNFDAEKMAVFKKECLLIDKRAEFRPHRLRAVRCSNCGQDTTCQAKKGAPNPRRFIEHHRKCTKGTIRIPKTTLPTSKTSTLTSGVFKGFQKLSTKTRYMLGLSPRSPSVTSSNFSEESPAPLPRQFSCPGINATYEPKVTPYLHRSSALGGGSRSVMKIAHQFFRSPFRNLSKAQKEEVIDQQDSEHTWCNNHRRMNVRSVACMKVSVDVDEDANILPCSECRALMLSKVFRNAIGLKMPDSGKQKYINKRFQNELLAHQWADTNGFKELIESAEKDSIYTRFVLGVISGKYDDEGVFLGLVHAMVQKKDKEERGVGMQNFQYTPEWDQFMHIASIHSPRTYEFIRSKFPGRTKRSFQVQESKAPKLAMTIEDATFASVANHLSAVGYSGPINVACDDSKLLSSFRLHYDSKNKKHFLVGGIDGPIFVRDPTDIANIMNDPSIKKGTKIRLWMGTIPLPDLPPFVIAALPILDSMSVANLLKLHNQIILGLLQRGVKVISYACDGTENERGVQQAFFSIADSVIERVIPDPHPGRPSLVIRIPVVHNCPIVMIQDSKHALKTFRNNLFSGARLLVLGNFLAMYRDVQSMAFEAGSPIYHRDVKKVDKQDDNAAARLGSAQTLQFLAENHPEQLGLIVYLFVFMEIPDAYQNCHIDHEERLNMLLRARYFVDMWTTYLDRCPGYTWMHYCISRESLDIVSYLIHGYISLVIIHHDYFPKIPLLPYLHSTESCEHVFGISRQIVKDFTILDFYRMIPKLTVQIRESFLSKSQHERSSDMKARAAGYHHTYFDTEKLNIAALSHFPSIDDMGRIAQRAASEADSLIAALGICPSDLHVVPSTLPSLQSWMPAEDIGSDDESELQDELDDISSVYSYEELQTLVQATQTPKALAEQSLAEQSHFEALSNAALLLTVEDQTKINSLEEIEDTIMDEHMAEDLRKVQRLREYIRKLPALELDTPTPIVFTPSTNSDHSDSGRTSFLQNLVSLREQHQTEHASKAVRIRGLQGASSDDATAQSLRRRMVTAFYDIQRLSQDRGVTTTADRLKRWTTQATGNSLNAQVTAAGNATQAMSKRRTLMLQAGIKPFEVPPEAGVSKKSPLLLHSWGFVFARVQKDNTHAYRLFVGKVEAMYAKGGGKNGKHSSVTRAENVAALSYIGLQLFQHVHASTFRATQTQPFQTLTYTFVPSIRFFALTHSQPRTILGASGEVVHLDAIDVTMYQTLSRYTQELTVFLKNHSKRKQSTRGPAAGISQTAENGAAPLMPHDDEDEDMGF